jgi:hypothetical protein
MLKKRNKLIVLGFALSLVLFIFSTSFAFEKAKFAVITDTHMALYGICSWMGSPGTWI